MIKMKDLLTEDMTRQHFQFVADLLKIKGQDKQVEFAIQFFKKQNPRFDENKFRKAVGVKPSIKTRRSSQQGDSDPDIYGTARGGYNFGPRGPMG